MCCYTSIKMGPKKGREKKKKKTLKKPLVKKVKNSMLKLKCHIRKYLLNAHESSEGEDLKDMRHKK